MRLMPRFAVWLGYGAMIFGLYSLVVALLRLAGFETAFVSIRAGYSSGDALLFGGGFFLLGFVASRFGQRELRVRNAHR